MRYALVLCLALLLVPDLADAQCEGDQKFAVAVYHFNVQYSSTPTPPGRWCSTS